MERERVLLIGPMNGVVDTCRTVLDRAGYAVVGMARNAQEALLLAQQVKPHLYVFELAPHADLGEDVIRQLKVRHAAPLLLITSALTPVQLADFVAAGVDAYEISPLSEAHLLELVRLLIFPPLMRVTDDTLPPDEQPSPGQGVLKAAKMARWEYWLSPDLDDVLFMDAAVEAITGYAPAEFQQDPSLLLRIVHPLDRAGMAQHCLTAREHPLLYTELVYRIVDRAGATHWVQHICTPLYEGDQYRGRRIVCLDVTPLQDVEQRFRVIFNEAPIGIALVDLQGRFVEVNVSFCRMLGYTPAELKGMTFNDLTYPEDRALSLEYYHALLQGEMTSASFEKRYVRKNGRTIWVAVSTTLVSDVQGRPLYFLTMFQNVTARKEMDALIRLQSAALQAAANGIVITDKDGSILWANPAMERMTGYTLAEMRGQNPRLFKSGYQDREFYQHLWDTILSGRVWQGELINRRKDGSLYHEELTITPLLRADGTPEHFIAVKQDVTARKQAEQAREQALASEKQLRLRAEALARASAALTRTLDLDALLVQILEAAVAAIPAAEKGSVLLPDETGKALYVHAATGYTTPEIKRLRFERGYAMEAFRQKIPIVVSDVFNGYQVFADIPEVGGLRSALAVPLKLKQRVLGVLCLDNATRTEAFNADDVTLLESFAAQAALALDNARMFAQVQRERETLHFLYDLSRRLSEAQKVEDVVSAVMDGCKWFDADWCELLLADDETTLYRCEGGKAQPRALDVKAAEMLLTRGLGAWALAQRQAVLVQDTQTDARWEPRPDWDKDTPPVRTVLCLPLGQRGGQVRGWLACYHHAPLHFKSDQLGLFVEMGERVSSVLEALHLRALQARYLERQRRLTYLASLLNRELELPALERVFLPAVLDLIGAEAGTVALYNEQRQAFVEPYHHQLPASVVWDTWPADKGVTGRLVREGRGAVIRDYLSQPESLAEWKAIPLRSGVSIPLYLEGTLLGLLEGYRFENPIPFTETDLELATYAGELFAVAVQRARLYDAERDQRVWASALLDATTALSQHLELEQVLDIIMEQAERVVAGEAFNIMLVDEQDPSWARVVRRRDRLGLRAVTDEVVHISDFPLLQSMVETSAPVLVNDTAQDARWRGELTMIRGYLGAPILLGTRLLGFLNVNSTQAGRFSEKDVERLRGFAAQAAIALENARLYRQLQAHADTLEVRVRERTQALNRRLQQQRLEAEVARDVNALTSLREMLQRTVDLIVERLGMYHATIFLVDEENSQRLRRMASAGYAAGQILAFDPYISITQGLVGTAARTGALVRSSDVRLDPRHRYNPYLPETRSEIALPLRTNEGIIGVLDVQSKQVDAFDMDDALSLQILADQIALSYQRLKHASLAQEQYARLQAVLQSTSDGILVALSDGTLERYNAAVERWLQMFDREQRARFYALVRDLAERAAERPQADVRLGPYDLQFKAMPIQDHGSGEVVISIHDITELKALDRMKTEFVSNVSHELRTPVTTILLYASLLQKSRGEEQQEYLEAIAAEAKRQAALVEDILTLSRFDAGRVELRLRPTELNAFAVEVVNTHRALARAAQLTLEFVPAPQEVVVQADAEKLTQVLNNLVENALRYTPAGGQVTVSVGREGDGARRWGLLRVQDTGVGIPPDELPHIFERFYRGSHPQKHQIQGTGLGLAIVDELVRLHQGRIKVDSAVGKGSTFTVYLPLVEEAA